MQSHSEELTNQKNHGNTMFADNFSPNEEEEEEDITFSGRDSSKYAGPKVSVTEERMDSSRSSPNDNSVYKTASS